MVAGCGPGFGNVPHQWALPIILPKKKAIMNLNMQRSQGVGGVGFLHLLFKSSKGSYT